MSFQNNVVYPRSKEEAGKDYWGTLFDIAAQYPESPTRADRIETSNGIKWVISKFVCKDCVEHAFEYINKYPIKLDSKDELMKWMCGLKNNANAHAGKEQIDCNMFTLSSINKNGGCKTCSLDSSIRVPYINTKNNEPIPAVPKTSMKIGSVLNWQDRYPSMKRSLMGDGMQSFGTINPAAGATMDLASKYPSLSGMSTPGGQEGGENQREELDGILSPLDNLYAIPAAGTGIEKSDFNLAYTPELTANLMTMLTQIYMTNFGSLFTTVTSSIGLLAISVFAKNALGKYDRLFLQNLTGSLLFHTLNFLNPRIRDEVLGDMGKMFEGVTSMNFDKIKGALLFGGSGKDGEKSNKELMKELVDMDKLPKSFAASGGVDPALNIKSSVPDLRMLGTSGTTTAPMNRGHIERQYATRNKMLTSPLEHTYNRNDYMRPPEPDLSMIDKIEDNWSYILDNALF